MKSVKIPSGGKRVSAVIHEGTENKLAVLMPGWLDSKDYLDITTVAEALNTIGFTAVRFEPIGTWDSDGTIEDYSVTSYIKSVSDVINYMEEANGKPFDVVVSGGKSLGGLVSTIVASRDKRISGVLSLVAPLTLFRGTETAWEKNGVRHSKRDLPDKPDEYIDLSVPWSYAEKAQQYNVFDALKNLHVPILFVVGEKDEKFPPEVVKEAYDTASEPKRMVVIPGATHDYRKQGDEMLKKVTDEVLLFVKDFLN